VGTNAPPTSCSSTSTGALFSCTGTSTTCSGKTLYGCAGTSWVSIH
jgi:hypothetical protein